MLLVFLTGGIDLSVGSIAGVSSMILAVTITNSRFSDTVGLALRKDSLYACLPM